MGSRRTNRVILFMLLVMVLAGGWYFYFQSRPDPIAPQVVQEKPAVKVVVSSRKLQFGDEIFRSDLRLIDWHEETPPEESFSSFEELLSPNERRVALTTIGRGEPLVKSRVSGFGRHATLSEIMAADMRAMTIRINEIVGVAGFIQPGDRVDVIVTRTDDGARARATGTVTHPVVRNVRVLAIDQSLLAQKVPKIGNVVTLELSEQQVQKVILARSVGSLTLVLRRIDEPGGPDNTMKVTRLPDIVPERPKPKAKVRRAAPSGATVSVVHGSRPTGNVQVPITGPTYAAPVQLGNPYDAGPYASQRGVDPAMADQLNIKPLAGQARQDDRQ